MHASAVNTFRLGGREMAGAGYAAARLRRRRSTSMRSSSVVRRPDRRSRCSAPVSRDTPQELRAERALQASSFRLGLAELDGHPVAWIRRHGRCVRLDAVVAAICERKTHPTEWGALAPQLASGGVIAALSEGLLEVDDLIVDRHVVDERLTGSPGRSRR